MQMSHPGLPSKSQQPSFSPLLWVRDLPRSRASGHLIDIINGYQATSNTYQHAQTHADIGRRISKIHRHIDTYIHTSASVIQRSFLSSCRWSRPPRTSALSAPWPSACRCSQGAMLSFALNFQSVASALTTTWHGRQGKV